MNEQNKELLLILHKENIFNNTILLGEVDCIENIYPLLNVSALTS
jgi:hypothetical protein